MYINTRTKGKTMIFEFLDALSHRVYNEFCLTDASFRHFLLEPNELQHPTVQLLAGKGE